MEWLDRLLHKDTGNRRAEENARFICFGSFNEMKLLSRDFAARWEAWKRPSSSFKNGIGQNQYNIVKLKNKIKKYKKIKIKMVWNDMGWLGHVQPGQTGGHLSEVSLICVVYLLSDKWELPNSLSCHGTSSYLARASPRFFHLNLHYLSS